MATLKEQMDQLVRIAEAVELAQNLGLASRLGTLTDEMIRRGYDIEGRSSDEVEEILKHCPTLPTQP